MFAHVLVFTAIVYVLIHVACHRHGRRAGFGFWYSVRGPWRTRWTMTKRF
jgi:hypothetical protein